MKGVLTFFGCYTIAVLSKTFLYTTFEECYEGLSSCGTGSMNFYWNSLIISIILAYN